MTWYDQLSIRRFEFVPFWGFMVLLLYRMRSEDSATPRFVLASSAIRCRFVDRFVRLRVLSRVSRQRFSSHGTPLSSTGSR
jgi:hypothetical protein